MIAYFSRFCAKAIGALAVFISLLAASATPVRAVTISEFPIPTANSAASFITAGPDGNLWFTEAGANQIGRITPSGVITEYAIPTLDSFPNGITSGPDGNLWFTESQGNQIGRTTPGGFVTEYAIPTDTSNPTGITAGPDGNLWFTEYNSAQVGRITTGGVVTEYPLPTANSYPYGITSGPDGNLWFTELADSGSAIGSITTAGIVTEYPLPTADSEPISITSGPDGNLWFTEQNSNSIGRITLTGTITEYMIPTAASEPVGIASGADGSLWFTEAASDQIGRITPAETITEYPIPTTAANLYGITNGPNSNLWFTETDGNNIGRLTPDLAHLSLALNAVPNSVMAGTGLTYTFTITNTGPAAAQNVVFNDALPANATFVVAASSPGLTLTNNTLSLNLGRLAANATAIVIVAVQVSPDAPDGSSLTNSATIASATPDTNTANNTATVTTLVTTQADVAVTQTGATAVNADNSLAYTFTVTNNGPSTASHIVFQDNLPPNTTFAALSQDSGPAFTATTPTVGVNGTITATWNSLPAGAAASFTLTAQVSASAPSNSTLSNAATVNSSTHDTTPSNNSATVTTTISPTPVATPTPVPTPTSTPLPPATPTPVPTPTPLPSATPTSPAPVVSVRFNNLATGDIYRTFPAMIGSVSESNAPAMAHLTAQVSLQRGSDGRYWSGKSWSQSHLLLPATVAHNNWSLPASALPHNAPHAQFVPDGKYNLTAIASDGLGHSAQVAITLLIDNTPPALTITTPPDKAIINALTTIGGKALDAPGGTGTQQIVLTLARLRDSKYWNGVAFVVAPKIKGQAQPPSLIVSVDKSNGVWARRSGLPSGSNLQPGTYRISAIAIDGAGNRSQAISNFTVAAPHTTPPPTVDLSNATASAALGSVTLKFSAALDADAASDPTHYAVAVNDHVIAVESVGYNASAHTVVLGLAEGSLRIGDRVAGQTGTLVAR